MTYNCFWIVLSVKNLPLLAEAISFVLSSDQKQLQAVSTSQNGHMRHRGTLEGLRDSQEYHTNSSAVMSNRSLFSVAIEVCRWSPIFEKSMLISKYHLYFIKSKTLWCHKMPWIIMKLTGESGTIRSFLEIMLVIPITQPKTIKRLLP